MIIPKTNMLLWQKQKRIIQKGFRFLWQSLNSVKYFTRTQDSGFLIKTMRIWTKSVRYVIWKNSWALVCAEKILKHVSLEDKNLNIWEGWLWGPIEDHYLPDFSCLSVMWYLFDIPMLFCYEDDQPWIQSHGRHSFGLWLKTCSSKNRSLRFSQN